MSEPHYFGDDKQKIGRFARSIESGWLGRVVAVEYHDSDTMLRMEGVNELYRTIKGGDIEAAIDHDDIQWFSPDDVTFLKEASDG